MTGRAIDRRIVFLLALAGCAAALAPGCGNPSHAFAPGATQARKALDDALGTWQSGGKASQLATGSPPVHPVDFQWQAGQALESYRIVADEPDEGGATKRFTVSLKLRPAKGAKAAPAETTTHYVVLGRDPVWVYREDDYARVLNMDNNPQPGPSRKRR